MISSENIQLQLCLVLDSVPPSSSLCFFKSFFMTNDLVVQADKRKPKIPQSYAQILLNSHDLLCIYSQVWSLRYNQRSILFIKFFKACTACCISAMRVNTVAEIGLGQVQHCQDVQHFSLIHSATGNFACTAAGRARTQFVGEEDFLCDAAGDSGEFN